VVDLLPDRSADTLAAWLKAHPSVSAVVRDRAGAYADGATRGAPDAIQVADRFHLLRNGSDALRTVLDQHHRDLRAAARAAQPPEPSVPDAPAIPEPAASPEPERPMRAAERQSRAAQERRAARFAEVARLRGQGLSLKAIARTLGLGRKTVRRWLRAGQAPTWRHADRGTSILDSYQAYLEERWQADRRFVAALLERSPAIATAVDLVSRFVTMVKDQVADALDGWLREAEASALAPFAAGLRRDEDAVRAALTEPWSNGQVEGQVNRLKVIKREMYGRAGFDLLRCRVLGHA
jgi:transposase